ncbi:hypothetical protein ACS0TY_015874 [Phlomoides rotata]
MEGEKKSGSSLASDLFGAKDSAATASSSGIFGSIFAPSSKVLGRGTLRLFENEKKNGYGNPAWSEKNSFSGSFPDSYAVGSEGQNKSMTSKDTKSYYPEEKPLPFHYSSSIYYGGQDAYFRPESAQNPLTTFKKDSGEDDPDSASRGNWWQGSLYY